ncbi:MAG TPA: nucleoside 2-deoxyribosyltransferase domain-containing protein [Tepidisphaeraceae bacterium]|nr:nucleoside 2-deoxyribosyltransferase domain-containing protein [Tepidisphaeraceae bacterium]
MRRVMGYQPVRTDGHAMRYIEAPNEVSELGGRSVFLAGGISGCDDWQTRLVALLADTDLTLLNPRRRDFPMDDPTAAEGQIAWEFRHLRAAWGRVFWFPPQTLCPITLFELGGACQSDRPLLVGTHPDYQRRQDVIIQLRLARPGVTVVHTLEALAEQVRRTAGTR